MNTNQYVITIVFCISSIILILGLILFEEIIVPKKNKIQDRLGGNDQIDTSYKSSNTAFGRFYARSMRALVHKDENSFKNLTKQFKIDSITLQKQIIDAHLKERITVEEVVAYKILGYAGLIIFVILWAISSNTVILFLSVLSFFLGGFYPQKMINNAVIKRQKEIENGLPEYIDLLKVVVEAGLPIQDAINHITERTNGPLSEEFLITMAETKTRGSWELAMSNMIERNDIDSLSDLLSALMISVSKGTSISDTLEEESKKLRELYSASFDEKAKKLSIKMLVPMLLFLFVPFFVLLLAPVMINMANM